MTSARSAIRNGGDSAWNRHFVSLKAAAAGWSADNVSRLSASLAYYAVFSLAPLLAILVAIIAMVYGREAAQHEISGGLAEWVGPQTAETIQSAVAQAGASKSSGIATIVIGFVALLFGASTVFGELKNSLNVIWEASVRPGRAVATIVRDRLLSFSMVLSVGFLLLISTVASAVLSGISQWLGSIVPIHPLVWKALDFCLSLTVISSLFAMIFRFLPNVVLRWRDVYPGALLAALLFTLGKSLMAWYLGTVATKSPFAGASFLVVVLVWVYYASGILFFGAEYTKALFLRRGNHLQADPNGLLLSDTGSNRS